MCQVNVAVCYILSQHRSIPEILCLHSLSFPELLEEEAEEIDTFTVNVMGAMM